MDRRVTRRALLGGAVSLASLGFGFNKSPAWAEGPTAPEVERFRVVHLSDVHWGYRGPWNRNVEASFRHVLSMMGALTPKPTLAVITGDLIQATSDATERIKRLHAMKEALDGLSIPWLAVPGEHDVFGDGGQAFERIIGPHWYHRTFRGVHFLGLDNVSRGPLLGHVQRHWLSEQSSRFGADAMVLVLSHAPLFDLFTPWNWYTYDGQAVFDATRAVKRRQFLFGHVHQALTNRHQGVDNTSGLPTAWPFPAPGPMERLTSWPEGASHPDMGLGFRIWDLAPGHIRTHVELLGKPLEEVSLT